MSGLYVPPCRREQDASNQSNLPAQNAHPTFNPSQRSRNGGTRIPHSQSFPERLAEISDTEVERLFAANVDTGDMSVYSGALVKIQTDNEIPPIDGFPHCGLQNEILLSVAQCGYKAPTSVQRYSIPYVLRGDDLLVTSQTGSGKTAAFMLPIISQVMRSRSGRPSALVLCPTRELAMQINRETLNFCRRSGLRTVCIIGGVSFNDQFRQLRAPHDILIACPGRLIDLQSRGTLDLSGIRYFVLDEADTMLDMGFEPQLRQILSDPSFPPIESRQTLLFSATFPPVVEALARSFMRQRALTKVTVGLQDAPKLIRQRFVHAPDAQKLQALLAVIQEVDGPTLVFVERKVTADMIEDYLYDQGCNVVAIHGDRDMVDRIAALQLFSSGKATIMVATDVAARGLDIPSVAHVINLDLPTDLDSYTHRIGRTGRAGKSGLATSFWNENNAGFLSALLQHLRQAKLPIPEGLEDYHAVNGGSRGGRGGHRGRGGRGGFPRDRSYQNMSRY